MKRMMGAILFALLLLTASALAADLDTPKVGAAVCAPEEENGSVVLHEAPDGRSETLMRYFQGAPLQVLDLADGWAHVRMGMTGKSLEGYISAGTVEIRRGGDARGAATCRNARL